MIYDIAKSYWDNVEAGPQFDRPIDFLGFQIASPIGVPAGPLLDSRWVALAARLGFDVLTYKTIRSAAHPGHAPPNMIYVEPISLNEARRIDGPPLNAEDLTVTNSFGMPSRGPDFLRTDIDAANRALRKDQLLIVSVVGTMGLGVSFLDDFVRTAVFAKEAGARVVEANFSCPNVHSSEGSLYQSPEAVREFTTAIARAIHPTPLILKVGEITDKGLLRQVLRAAALGGARAVCGLNSVSMRVTDGAGRPALGAGRETSGVCGGAIRSRALAFISGAAQIIREDRLDLALLGCGGITTAEHFDLFLEAGALIAMSATGMMWNPLLARQYHGKVDFTTV